jgi:hypothetical protein
VKKPIKILKKLTGSARFRFYKSEIEKTEPKPEKTEPNQYESTFFLKNPTETGQFEPVLVFFFKFSLVIFFIKTEPYKK